MSPETEQISRISYQNNTLCVIYILLKPLRRKDMSEK